MFPPRLFLLSLAVWGSSAFQDTSPFFYFSTVDTHNSPHNHPQLTRSKALLHTLQNRLSQCNSDTYIIAVQPGVNAADFALADAAPNLRQNMLLGEGRRSSKASFGVSDVLGELDVDEVESFLHKACKAEVLNVDASTGSFQAVDDMKPRAVRVEFPTLSLVKGQRARQLRENDSFLSSLLDLLPSPKYTVVYATTPLPAKDINILSNTAESNREHELPYIPTHAELRRQVNAREEDGSQPNVTFVDGPLFHRYQFFTPGLFMGLLVSLLLLAILSVGVNALGSLQVSYGAFDKEMGPAAQRKQQ